MSVNKVIAIGNLGQDPEMRFTPSGSPVTNFSIACTKKYTTKAGEKKEDTEWMNIVAWNKTAEICNQFLAKGSKVYIEGELKTRSWEGDDGVKHYKTEVIANRVEILSWKPEADAEKESDIEPDEIPF